MYKRHPSALRHLLAVLGGLVIAGVGGAASAAGAARCEAPFAVYRAGKAVESACPAELAERGLTAIDLGDDWTPYALAGAAIAAGQAPPAYRATFVTLAGEKFAPGSITEEDGSLEFYGIPPNFHVVLTRMDDEARHRCHDGVDDAALEQVRGTLRWERRATGDGRVAALAKQRGLVDAAIKKRGLAGRDERMKVSPAFARLVEELARAEAKAGAITAMQAHLACAGLLPGEHAGRFDWHTAEALRAYQRRHWVVASGEVDRETIAALREDPRELELRLALRVLRRRVADAAGLIEDGSARAEWGTVLGRTLDGPEMQYQGGYPALTNGAPDLISAATGAAVTALGWTDLATTRASLREHLKAEARPVAVKLPPAPAYHRKGVEFRAEIDRGEVSYDVPDRPGASRAGKAAVKRPVIVVYARDGDRETALVRWPTTIGGWQDEKLKNGAVVRKYKPSDTGKRMWRDLVVAPVWYPPKSTPDDDLVRARAGKWELKEELVGPGYRSAYGLAMLIHHMVLPSGEFYDRAIRTHGSVNYQSIARGDSHGCHRTFNHQVLGLSSFLLRHHAYTVKGPLQEKFIRKVRHKRTRYTIRRDDRGFYYELTPPVPVEVLEGTVVSRRKTPVKAALYGMR